MKKFLSLLLCLAIFTGVFSVLCGTLVFAEGGNVEATVWNPVEITLTTSKDYQNPYDDVQIDAVFKHEDGTELKTPGFWKEDKTWAVRFSPTKTGTWTYTVTSTDTANTGLHNITGTVIAKENDASTDLDKHGFVTIGENARYFSYADGTPFFWLGDTNWQAPNYVQTDACNYPGCNCKNQFKHEVDNRVKKGFNVYQTYFDSGESDGGGQRGILPGIWKKKYSLPNTDVFNKKIDYMFEYLHSQGMVVALGFGVHKSTMAAIGEEDYLKFVRYVVARYSCYSIVWINGQEITDDTVAGATPGKTVQDVYMSGAALVEELDGYRHPNGAHMYPMTSTDARAMKLDQSDWHDWWTLQGGHGRRIREKSFYRSYFLTSSGKIKPYIETEANYEDINCGGFTGYDANRLSAWSGAVNGSAGFTYGVAGIWANCYSNEKNTGWFGPSSYSYEPWYMGLDKPGSYEVSYMKKFFETIPDWTKLVPRFANIGYADFAEDNEKVISTTDDRTTAVVYMYNDDISTGTIKYLDSSKQYKAFWFNPLTGKFIPLGDVALNGDSYTMPEKPTVQDWAFVITSEELNGTYYTEAANTIIEETEIPANSKLITPYKVSAVGGIYYSGGKEIDITGRLYDNKGETAWEPLSDRVTQTIIYDLGVAYNLAHVAIVPATNTVLPGYRIEGSNDGTSWTILKNTASTGKVTQSSDGKYVDEVVAGAYRYVKILLLNAEDIPENEAKSASYMITYNETNSNSYYSHTAIAEISVFGTGVAENATVDSPVTGDDAQGATETPGVTDASTATEGGLGAGLATGIIAGAAVVGIVIGVVVAMVIKKKKD